MVSRHAPLRCQIDRLSSSAPSAAESGSVTHTLWDMGKKNRKKEVQQGERDMASSGQTSIPYSRMRCLWTPCQPRTAFIPQVTAQPFSLPWAGSKSTQYLASFPRFTLNPSTENKRKTTKKPFHGTAETFLFQNPYDFHTLKG